MKAVCLTILLIFWFIFTILMIMTIIGIFLMASPADSPRSTWMEIGFRITNALIESEK